MSVLITGCAGFIGSHVTEEFLNQKHVVVGIDALTYAGNLNNLKNVLDKDANFVFYQDDICNYDILCSIVERYGVRWIINLAAETHVDNSIQSCERFVHSNVNGVRSILDICRHYDVKLLHVSTDEVYGQIVDGSFDEDDKLNPRNPYSATKAAAEHLITSYANTYKTESIIVRPCNNFGPRQHDEKFIPTIVRSIKSGQKIPLYGNGTNVRDWLFVRENARAIHYIVTRCPRIGETFNVSLKNEMSNIDLIKKILKILDLNFADCVQFVDDRPGHDLRYSINNNHLSLSGFAGIYNFDDCLKETVKFFMEKVIND